MAGFAKDVVTSIDVPDVSPLQTNQGSTLGDVTAAATFGLQVLDRSNAKDAKAAAVVKQEKMAGAVLKINNFKIETEGQGLSSIKRQAAQTKFLEGFSSVDQLTIIEEVAKSGRFVNEKRQAEIAEVKAVSEQEDEWAVKYAGESTMSDGDVRDKVERGLSEDARMLADKRAHDFKMRQLSLSGATITNNAAVAGQQADIMMAEIAVSSRQNIDIAITKLEKQRDLPKGSEGKLNQQQFQEEVIGLMDRGRAAMSTALTSMAGGQPPLVKSKLLANQAAFLDSYELLKTEYIDSASGSRYQKGLLGLLKNKQQDIELEILSDPTTLALKVAMDLKLAPDANALAEVGGLVYESLGNVAKHVSKVAKNASSLPSFQSRQSYLSKQFADSDGVDSPEVIEAIDVTAKAQNDVLNDITKGVIGDRDGQKLDWGVNDVSKTMESIIDSPVKGNFTKHSVKLVTDTVMQRWEKMSPEQQEKIKDKMPAYTVRYFGDNTSGAFVPAVLESYKKIVSVEGKPLYTIGMDPVTKGFKVVISSDAEILKQARLDESSNQFTLSTLKPVKERVRKMKLDLVRWAKKVERMEAPSSVINALSKSTGTPKEAVTEQLLRQMGATSSLSVDPAFTLPLSKPTPVATPDEVLRPVEDTSDMSDEEFDVYQKLQLDRRKTKQQ